MKSFIFTFLFISTYIVFGHSNNVLRTGDIMTGSLTVPDLYISGSNDWYVGNPTLPIDIVIANTNGKIRTSLGSNNDLTIEADGTGKIQLNSTIMMNNYDIIEAGKIETDSIILKGKHYPIGPYPNIKWDMVSDDGSTTNLHYIMSDGANFKFSSQMLQTNTGCGFWWTMNNPIDGWYNALWLTRRPEYSNYLHNTALRLFHPLIMDGQDIIDTGKIETESVTFNGKHWPSGPYGSIKWNMISDNGSATNLHYILSDGNNFKFSSQMMQTNSGCGFWWKMKSPVDGSYNVLWLTRRPEYSNYLHNTALRLFHPLIMDGQDIVEVGEIQLNTNGLLRLTPRTAPNNPTEGTIYYDDSLHRLRCYNGTTWQNL